MEAAECGAACLAMVLASFGRWETLDAVRDTCGVSRDGTSVEDILEAARQRGLEANAYSLEIEELGNLPLPQILFWGFDHFVVLEAISRNGFEIIDPAHGRRHVDRAEFDRQFTGVTMAFRPGPAFEPSGRERGVLSRLLPLLRGSRGMLTAIILGSATMVALGALVPGLTRVYVDDYLVQGYGDWLLPLLAAIVVIGGLGTILNALHVHGVLLLQTKLNAVLSARFVWRLFRLPHEFFVRRSVVEVSSRTQLAGQVSGTISGPLTQAAVNGLAMAGYTAVMLCYSVTLTAVVIVSTLIDLAILRMVARRLQEQAVLLQMVTGQAHAAAVQSAALLEQARATGSETVLFDRMVQAQARLINAEQTSGRTTRLIAALPFASSRLRTLAVLGAGAVTVINTDMTLGTLLAFLMLAELFSAAWGPFIGLSPALSQSGAAIGRLGDALEAPAGADEDAPADAPAATGRIALRQVGFAYPNGGTVIADATLDIAPGECIGIMGGPGSGKSTLARLVAGLVTPTHGEIAFETQAADRLSWSPDSGGIGFVDQQPFFAGGPLRAALTLWDGKAETADIRRALTDAEVLSVVEARPGGLDGAIGEGGSGFSSGEQQRLALARALVGNPRILVLDDGTSALDEGNEARVIENLRRRGVTLILLTNRVSAVRHLDRAVALRDGRLVPVAIEEIYAAARVPVPA